MNAYSADGMSKSIKALIAANAITIVLAVVENWDLRELMFIYWTQSVVIGFFSYQRMLDLKQFSTEGVRQNGCRVEPTEKTKKSMASFFLLHYGAFHAFYLVFILAADKREFQDSYFFVMVCAAVFALNHWYSYRENREKDADRKPNIGTIMLFPYARIVPMHLTLIAGGSMNSESTLVLLMFLGLKTAADVVMHMIEHSSWQGVPEKPFRSDA